MFDFNKTTISMLILSTNLAFAGAMGPVCNKDTVSLPCHETWEVGIYGLYLQPSYNGDPEQFNIPVGTQFSIEDSLGTVLVRPNLNKDWQWGFKLEAAYNFNTGNDLKVTYYHWNDTTKQRLFTEETVVSETDGITLIPTSTFLLPIITAQWDAINFESGQQLDIGPLKNIRVYGGAQYMRLHHKKTITTIESTSDEAKRSHAFHRFIGGGPRAGLDLNHEWTNGLGLYANGGIALLVGESKFRLLSDSGVRGSFTAIVPGLDMKAGLNYTYVMETGNLKLDLGYLMLNYFRPFHTGASNFGTDGLASDFGLQGPYIGLKWTGNA